jgi:hypothetical protein
MTTVWGMMGGGSIVRPPGVPFEPLPPHAAANTANAKKQRTRWRALMR